MNQTHVIQRKIVEAQINEFRARIVMQKAMIEAHAQRSLTERVLVEAVVGIIAAPKIRATTAVVLSEALSDWKASQQSESKAREDLLRFELAVLESELTIHIAQLAEGEKNVVVPGAFRQ